MNRPRLTHKEAMVYVSEMGQKAGVPGCYFWAAKWWRLHSKESKNPSEPLRYSRNQLSLYNDMVSRPDHYKSRMRPVGMSDWQWSGLCDRHS